MAASTAGASRISVLHVDDDPDFAELTAEYLEREDSRLSVDTATSVSDALDRLADGQFDCLVSDYDMPGRNGIDLLEAVREDDPDLPFILFTGKGSEEVASSAISAGVTDYLQKQTGTDQYSILVNRIRNAVERVRVKRKQKRQLEAIETAEEGIGILDEDGQYLYVNEAFADLHGYQVGEMVGEHWEMVYPDDHVPRVTEEILPQVEQEGYWHGETTSLRADGTTVAVDHTFALTDDGELVCTIRDLSARKERERKLERSLTRLEGLFENSPDMIHVHDADGNIIDPNPRLCEATGYDAADLSDMKVWELNETLDPETARTRWETMTAGDSRRVESAYRCQDGSTVAVEAHIQRLSLGGAERFVTIARDISERKEMTRQRKRAETTFEHAQDALFLIDVDDDRTFRVQRVNRAYEELTGLRTEDMRGKTPDEILSEDEAAAVVTRYQDCLERGAPIEYDEELTINGETRYWHTRLAPVIRDGQVVKLVGATRDITERRQRIEETAELKRQYQTLSENIPNGAVFLFDDDLEYVRARGTELEAVGLSPDDIEGATPEEVFPADLAEGLTHYFTEALAGSTHTFTQSLGESTYRNRVAPVENSAGEITHGIALAQNVTDQVERKRRLEAKNDRLEEFARVVSHDLRNPLQVADGRLELLGEQYESEHIDAAVQAVSRMDALTEDLLILAREGEPVGTTEPVDLGEVLAACCRTVETADAAIDVRIDRVIEADRSRLAQLLENLIQNAVEHGGTTVTITVGALTDGFYVEDDGPGIPERERSEVFDAGYSTTEDGTGFGLSIVSEVADAHGWDVRVTDGTDGGARFEVTGVEFAE